MPKEINLDALVVGGGFSGIYILQNLRKRGFRVKLYEAGNYIGGTWHWNRYPGARVDSDIPTYRFSDPATWDFPWTERFPQHAELRQYFRYLDSVWDLSKDTEFNTCVSEAKFHNGRSQWEVKTEDGWTTWTRHLFLCTGSTSSKYLPPFEGLEKFKGECYHSFDWPKSMVDFEGKRVAVIGTGATGVQIIQELGPKVVHLTVYQRTPNNCLPMQNAKFEDPTKKKFFPSKYEYPAIFEHVRKTKNGFVYQFANKNTLDDSGPERRNFYESLFAYGAAAFWLGNYQDVLISQTANSLAYDFWAEKTRARIEDDPCKKNLLAPLHPIHPFGTKRPCLETSYYEVFNQNNVDLIISLRDSPIVEVTEKGIKSSREGVVEVDVILITTGFDSLTGSFTNIDIRNGRGESLREHWKERGTSTYLGVATAGFPNLWYMYGPQGPTPFSNAPVIIEIQGEWLVEMLVRMRQQGREFVEAKKVAEEDWQKEVNDAWDSTLLRDADSWYPGLKYSRQEEGATLLRRRKSKIFRSILKEVEESNYSTFDIA